jgi:hypothetical protein
MVGTGDPSTLRSSATEDGPVPTGDPTAGTEQNHQSSKDNLTRTPHNLHSSVSVACLMLTLLRCLEAFSVEISKNEEMRYFVADAGAVEGRARQQNL